MLFVNSRFFEVLKFHREHFPDSKKPVLLYTMTLLGFVSGFSAYLLWHSN